MANYDTSVLNSAFVPCSVGSKVPDSLQNASHTAISFISASVAAERVLGSSSTIACTQQLCSGIFGMGMSTLLCERRVSVMRSDLEKEATRLAQRFPSRARAEGLRTQLHVEVAAVRQSADAILSLGGTAPRLDDLTGAQGRFIVALVACTMNRELMLHTSVTSKPSNLTGLSQEESTWALGHTQTLCAIVSAEINKYASSESIRLGSRPTDSIHEKGKAVNDEMDGDAAAPSSFAASCPTTSTALPVWMLLVACLGPAVLGPVGEQLAQPQAIGDSAWGATLPTILASVLGLVQRSAVSLTCSTAGRSAVSLSALATFSAGVESSGALIRAALAAQPTARPSHSTGVHCSDPATSAVGLSDKSPIALSPLQWLCMAGRSQVEGRGTGVNPSAYVWSHTPPLAGASTVPVDPCTQRMCDALHIVAGACAVLLRDAIAGPPVRSQRHGHDDRLTPPLITPSPAVKAHVVRALHGWASLPFLAKARERDREGDVSEPAAQLVGSLLSSSTPSPSPRGMLLRQWLQSSTPLSKVAARKRQFPGSEVAALAAFLRNMPPSTSAAGAHAGAVDVCTAVSAALAALEKGGESFDMKSLPVPPALSEAWTRVLELRRWLQERFESLKEEDSSFEGAVAAIRKCVPVSESGNGSAGVSLAGPAMITDDAEEEEEDVEGAHAGAGASTVSGSFMRGGLYAGLPASAEGEREACVRGCVTRLRRAGYRPMGGRDVGQGLLSGLTGPSASAGLAVPGVAGDNGGTIINPGEECRALAALCGLVSGAITGQEIIAASIAGKALSGVLLSALEQDIERRLWECALQSGGGQRMVGEIPSLARIAALSRHAHATHAAVWPSATASLIHTLNSSADKPLVGRWLHESMDASAAHGTGKSSSCTPASRLMLALVTWGREGWAADGADLLAMQEWRMRVASERAEALTCATSFVVALQHLLPSAAADVISSVTSGFSIARAFAGDAIGLSTSENAMRASGQFPGASQPALAMQAYLACTSLPSSVLVGVEGCPPLQAQRLHESAGAFVRVSCGRAKEAIRLLHDGANSGSMGAHDLTGVEVDETSAPHLLLPTLAVLCSTDIIEGTGGWDGGTQQAVEGVLDHLLAATSLSTKAASAAFALRRAALHALSGQAASGAHWQAVPSRILLLALASGVVDEAAVLLHLYAGGVAMGCPGAVNEALAAVTGRELGCSIASCVGLPDVDTDPVSPPQEFEGEGALCFPEVEEWRPIAQSTEEDDEPGRWRGGLTGPVLAQGLEPLPHGLELVSAEESKEEEEEDDGPREEGMEVENMEVSAQGTGVTGMDEDEPGLGAASAACCPAAPCTASEGRAQALLASVRSVLAFAGGDLGLPLLLQLHTAFLRLPRVASQLHGDFLRAQASAACARAAGREEDEDGGGDMDVPMALREGERGGRAALARKAIGEKDGSFGFGGVWGAQFGGTHSLSAFSRLHDVLSKEYATGGGVGGGVGDHAGAADGDPLSWGTDDGLDGPALLSACTLELTTLIGDAEEGITGAAASRVALLLTGSPLLALQPILEASAGALERVLVNASSAAPSAGVTLLSRACQDTQIAAAAVLRETGSARSAPTGSTDARISCTQARVFLRRALTRLQRTCALLPPTLLACAFTQSSKSAADRGGAFSESTRLVFLLRLLLSACVPLCAKHSVLSILSRVLPAVEDAGVSVHSIVVQDRTGQVGGGGVGVGGKRSVHLTDALLTLIGASFAICNSKDGMVRRPNNGKAQSDAGPENPFLGGQWGPGTAVEYDSLAGRALFLLRSLQGGPSVAWANEVGSRLSGAIIEGNLHAQAACAATPEAGAGVVHSAILRACAACTVLGGDPGAAGGVLPVRIGSTVRVSYAALCPSNGGDIPGMMQPSACVGYMNGSEGEGEGVVLCVCGSVGRALVLLGWSRPSTPTPSLPAPSLLHSHSLSCAGDGADPSPSAIAAGACWVPLSSLTTLREAVQPCGMGVLQTRPFVHACTALLSLPSLDASPFVPEIRMDKDDKPGTGWGTGSVTPLSSRLGLHLSSSMSSQMGSFGGRASTSADAGFLGQSHGKAALAVQPVHVSVCRLKAAAAAAVHMLIHVTGRAGGGGAPLRNRFADAFLLSGGLRALASLALVPLPFPGFPRLDALASAAVGTSFLLFDLATPGPTPPGAAGEGVSWPRVRDRCILPRASSLTSTTSAVSPTALHTSFTAAASDVYAGQRTAVHVVGLTGTDTAHASLAEPQPKVRNRDRDRDRVRVRAAPHPRPGTSMAHPARDFPPPDSDPVQWDTAGTLHAMLGGRFSKYWCYKVLGESASADDAAMALMTTADKEPPGYAAKQSAAAEKYAMESVGGGVALTGAGNGGSLLPVPMGAGAGLSNPVPLSFLPGCCPDYPYDMEPGGEGEGEGEGEDAAGLDIGGAGAGVPTHIPPPSHSLSGNIHGTGGAVRFNESMVESISFNEPLILDGPARLPVGYRPLSRTQWLSAVAQSGAHVVGAVPLSAAERRAMLQAEGASTVAPSLHSLPFPYGPPFSLGGAADLVGDLEPGPSRSGAGSADAVAAWRGHSAAAYWAECGPAGTGTRAFLAHAATVGLSRPVALRRLAQLSTRPDAHVALSVALPRHAATRTPRGTIVWVEARAGGEAILCTQPITRSAGTHEKLASLSLAALRKTADAVLRLVGGAGCGRGVLATVRRHFTACIPTAELMPGPGSCPALSRADALALQQGTLPSAFDPGMYEVDMTLIRVAAPCSAALGGAVRACTLRRRQDGLCLEVPSAWLHLPVASYGASIADTPLMAHPAHLRSSGCCTLLAQCAAALQAAASLSARATLVTLLTAWPVHLPLTLHKLAPPLEEFPGERTHAAGAAVLLAVLKLTAADEGVLTQGGLFKEIQPVGGSGVRAGGVHGGAVVLTPSAVPGGVSEERGAGGQGAGVRVGGDGASGVLTSALQATVVSLLAAEAMDRDRSGSAGMAAVWCCTACGCVNYPADTSTRSAQCGECQAPAPIAAPAPVSSKVSHPAPSPPPLSSLPLPLATLLVTSSLDDLSFAADACARAGARSVARASTHPMSAMKGPFESGTVSCPGAACLWVTFDENCSTDPADESSYVEIFAADTSTSPWAATAPIGSAAEPGRVATMGGSVVRLSGGSHSFKPFLVRADTLHYIVARGKATNGRPARGMLADGGFGLQMTVTPLPGLVWAHSSDVLHSPSFLWAAHTLDFLLSGGLSHAQLLSGLLHNARTLRCLWDYLRTPAAPFKDRVLGLLHKVLAGAEYTLLAPGHADYEKAGTRAVVEALAGGPSRVPSAAAHTELDRAYLQRLTCIPLNDLDSMRSLALDLKASAETGRVTGAGLFLPAHLQRMLECVATAEGALRRARVQLHLLGATAGQLYTAGDSSRALLIAPPALTLSSLSEEGRLVLSMAARADACVPHFDRQSLAFPGGSPPTSGPGLDSGWTPPLIPVKPPLISMMTELGALTCLREALVALVTARRLPDAWMLRAVILATRDNPNDLSGLSLNVVAEAHVASAGFSIGEDEALLAFLASTAARRGLASALELSPTKLDLNEADTSTYPALERFRASGLAGIAGLPTPTFSLRVRVAVILILNNLYKRSLPCIDMTAWNETWLNGPDGAGGEGMSPTGARVVPHPASYGGAGEARLRSSLIFASHTHALTSLTVGSLLKRVPHMLLTDAKEALITRAVASTETPGTSLVKVMLDNRASMTSAANRVLSVPLSLCSFAQLVRHMLEAKVPDRSLRCKLSSRDTLFEVAFVGLEGNAEVGMDWGGLYRDALSRAMNDLFGDGDARGIDLFVLSPTAEAARAGQDAAVAGAAVATETLAQLGDGSFLPNPRYCPFNVAALSGPGSHVGGAAPPVGGSRAAGQGTGSSVAPSSTLSSSFDGLPTGQISPSTFALSSTMYEWLGRLLGISIRTRSGDLDADLSAVAWRLIATEAVGLADVVVLDQALGSFLTRLSTWTWNTEAGNGGSGVARTEAEAFSEEFGPLFFVAPDSALMTLAGAGGPGGNLGLPGSVAGGEPASPGVDVSSAAVRQLFARPLVPGGASLPVTPANRHRYVRLVWRAALAPFAHACACIRRGMARIVPDRALALCGWRDLRRLACGEPSVDLDTLLANTKYDNNGIYHKDHPVVKWFWQAMAGLTPVQLSQFVRFAWGRANLPRGKWPLQSNGQPVRFTIVPQRGRTQGLPLAHTCFFLIELPEYRNLEDLRKALITAITWGAGEAFLIA